MLVVCSSVLQAQRQPTDAKERGQKKTSNVQRQQWQQIRDMGGVGGPLKTAHRSHSITYFNDIKEVGCVFVCKKIHQRQSKERKRGLGSLGSATTHKGKRISVQYFLPSFSFATASPLEIWKG